MILANHGIIASSGGSVPLLLDTYSGATTAYSLRKLRSAYTGYAIRVRRSSDNTSQDIGFDGSGNLDTTTLLSFVGAGNGNVSLWYDQSGYGHNLAQTTLVNQPFIIENGIMFTANGKANIVTNGSSFLYNSTCSVNGETNSIFSTLTLTPIRAVMAMSSNDTNFGQLFPSYSSSGNDRYYDSPTAISASPLNSGLNLLSFHENTLGITVYENNSLLTANYTHNTTNGNGLFLFKRDAGNGLNSNCGINEFIIYSGLSKLSDNYNISTNINSYYSIY